MSDTQGHLLALRMIVTRLVVMSLARNPQAVEVIEEIRRDIDVKLQRMREAESKEDRARAFAAADQCANQILDDAQKLFLGRR